MDFTQPSLENEYEIIEFYLDGDLVNKTKCLKENAHTKVKYFYESKKVSRNAEVFFIRQSKMNFKSILHES